MRLTYGYSLPGLARYPVILTNLGDQRIPYEFQNPGPSVGEGKETGLVLRLRSVVLGLRSCSQLPLRRSSNPARSQADRQGATASGHRKLDKALRKGGSSEPG